MVVCPALRWNGNHGLEQPKVMYPGSIWEGLIRENFEERLVAPKKMGGFYERKPPWKSHESDVQAIQETTTG
jgi:hypothetical protein